MQIQDLPRNGYARPDGPVRSARAIEYDLFARVTAALSAAVAAADGPGLIRALFNNERLWRHLAGEVAGNDNGLPAELRARLFYLYEFTAAHSRKVRVGEASAEVLVDINTAVMRGLRGEGAR